MIVRGSVVYWFLFLVFRFVLRRDVGSIGVADLLFVVLVADVASNAMQGEYRSISDGRCSCRRSSAGTLRWTG